MLKMTDIESSIEVQSTLFNIINQAAILSVTDTQGLIQWVNDEFTRISEYSKEELIGQDHRLLNSGYHDKAFMANLWQTIQSGKVWHGLVRNRKKMGGLYWVDSTIAPLFHRVGTQNKVSGFLSVRFEVTEEVRRHEQHLLAEKQLGLASKLAIIGEMSGTIAHEINNPLAIIQLASQQLERHLKRLPESVQKDIGTHVERIDRMCGRIAKTIRALKSTVRNSANDPIEIVPMTKMLEDAVELVRPHLVKKQIRLEFDANLLEKTSLHCRPGEMIQVLVNLLKNSADALPIDGSGWIRLSAEAGPTATTIRIQDAGSGIPKEIAEKMFDPLFTTKGPENGNGLGLPVCRKIVESLGGQIRYCPEVSNTQFEVTVPFAPPRLLK